MHHPTDRIAHTTAFVTPVVEHWPEREIAQWVHPMKDRPNDPSREVTIVVVIMGATIRSKTYCDIVIIGTKYLCLLLFVAVVGFVLFCLLVVVVFVYCCFLSFLF